MKTIERNSAKKGLIKSKLNYALLLIAIIALSSCTEDYFVIETDQPSRAYLALSWSQDEPDYIDAGTGAIPAVFYYNDYYRINPGYYFLYYDGVFYDGYGYIDYAWEVEYEIYTNSGYYNDDNYFTIDMNPYGPYVYLDYKSTPASEFQVLEEGENRIIILKKQEQYNLKITYNKTEKREQ